MKKYKNFLETKHGIMQVITAVLFAVLMLVIINIEMDTPIDSKELEYHYSQLEMIKQDISSIYQLENAEISIHEHGMDVTLKGKHHNLNAFFDENNSYLNATFVDTRLGADITESILVVILAGVLGWIVFYLVLIVLYIPVIIHAIIALIIKKHHAKKEKQK